ncbi:hypothetical protein BDV28DRAFT_145262 [Aspergillus coremiiformis]|uniref:Uncharacterized protein n=1 Tax=Aspergillus coremiiformis TaxID=138285 RepID=A0A5N6ZHI9_9EURO|nr:hypothetical protein BDV28DRAFT_145262 [Aspergillus coremiiformis]
MKLFAPHPRQFANSRGTVPPSERDIGFENAAKLLDYVHLMHGGRHGLEKCMWQIGTSYVWNAVLYVLIEVRHRKSGALETSTGPVYMARRKWTPEVWDDYVAASKAENLPSFEMDPNEWIQWEQLPTEQDGFTHIVERN